MSPVVMRNRMRTRSVSRADAAESPMKKSSSRCQRPRRQSQVDDDGGATMTKSELARTIAEFRVGFFPSKESNHSHAGVVEAVDDTTDTNVEEKMDAQQNELAHVSDQSPTSPVPSTKATSCEGNATHPGNATQTSITAIMTPSPYSLQTPQPDENRIASLEGPPASTSTGPHRRGFSSSERELLEAAFHIADNPGTATMKLLVHLTGLDKKKIRGWFRTRRIRQEREEANVESSSVSEPKHHVPPQYWPEPLRFSHMQRQYPVPGYRAPPGIPPTMAQCIPPMAPGMLPMIPGMPPVIPGIPPMTPGTTPLAPGIPSLPSKLPPTPWYPPPPVAPTMGFLPPPLGHSYPPFSFNTGLPLHPTITKDGPLSSGLPAESQGTPTVVAPKVPTGPWYPSLTTGHPLQGVIPQTTPTPNVPSGLQPGGFLHPWSSVGCYPAPGMTPQHHTPYPPHPALPYCSPWYPVLPAPNARSPALRQTGAQAETPEINAASTSRTVKPLPSQVIIQEVMEAEPEAASNA